MPMESGSEEVDVGNLLGLFVQRGNSGIQLAELFLTLSFLLPLRCTQRAVTLIGLRNEFGNLPSPDVFTDHLAALSPGARVIAPASLPFFPGHVVLHLSRYPAFPSIQCSALLSAWLDGLMDSAQRALLRVASSEWLMPDSSSQRWLQSAPRQSGALAKCAKTKGQKERNPV
jgi:hypothetical protein